MPTPAQTSRGFRVNFLASGVWNLLAALLGGLTSIAWLQYLLKDPEVNEEILIEEFSYYFIITSIVFIGSVCIDIWLTIVSWKGNRQLKKLLISSSSPWFAYNAMISAITMSIDNGTEPTLIWSGTGITLTLGTMLLRFWLISDINHNLWLLTWPLAVFCYLSILFIWGYVAVMAFIFM